MPYPKKIKCNKCDFSSSGGEIWGSFSYEFLNNGNKYYVYVNRKRGWCYECNKVSPVEYFTSVNEEGDLI